MAKKPNKRITKKQTKKKLQQRFHDSDSSYKQLQKKQQKADKQKQYRQRTYEKKTAYAKQKGYNGIIPKSWTYEQIEKAVRAQQRKNRIENKYNMLIAGGLDEQYARYLANKDTGYKKINDIIGVFKASAWLGVVWADETEETDLSWAMQEAMSMNATELIEYVRMMYEEALFNPDDSSDFKGVAIVIISPSQSDCERQINLANLRGYGVKICCDNEFTTWGLVRIMYTAMCQTSADCRIRVFQAIEKYIYNFIGGETSIYQRIFGE